MDPVVRSLLHSRAGSLTDPIRLSNPTSGCAGNWGEESRLAWHGLGTRQPPWTLLGCCCGSPPHPGEAHRPLALSLAKLSTSRSRELGPRDRPWSGRSPIVSFCQGMRRNWFGGVVFLSFSPEEEMGSTEPGRKMQ